MLSLSTCNLYKGSLIPYIFLSINKILVSYAKNITHTQIKAAVTISTGSGQTIQQIRICVGQTVPQEFLQRSIKSYK